MYRFFTDERSLRHYVEELLNVDLDGDGVVGERQSDAPEGASAAPAGVTPKQVLEPRTWYVNFGDNLRRSWSDARTFGFVSAGGGRWYSRPLHRLLPGDTLLVYLPGKGYAGIATVTRRAVPFEDAVVDGQNGPERLADLSLDGPYTHETTRDDPGEYVVSVEWAVALDKPQAYKEVGLFSNQATAVQMRPEVPRHAHTIESVPRRLMGEA